MSLRKLPESTLAGLADEELFNHAMRARAYGDHDYARLCLQILAFRHWDNLVRFISVRAPIEDCPEIADRTVADAFKARFNGSSIEEFRALLYTIARRRRADYYRKGRIEADPLAEEHAGDDSVWGEVPHSAPDIGLVGLLELIGQSAEPLPPAHLRVLELGLISDLDSDTVATQVNEDFPSLSSPMTSGNVDKIKSRFRKDLRQRLDENG